MKSIRIKEFKSSGELKYTWEQNLDEVILYFNKENLYGNAKNIKKINKSDLNIYISSNEIKITNKLTNKYILNEILFDKIDKAESLWYIENEELILQLSKMRKGYVWDSINKTDENKLNPIDIENMKKQMMLERFQRENPGFDFSNAEFNGNIPDPREFMGGLKRY